METVFVTGGSSALGQHALRRLSSRAKIVAVIHRRSFAIPGVKIDLLNGGLEEAVRDPTALHKAELVLHMAGVTHADDPSEYLRVNLELTKRLLSACRPHQHLVYVSTICAHPDGGDYGRSKWLAEEAIRNSGLNFTIIRPAEIYGSKNREGIDALITFARKTHIMPDFRCHGSVKYAPISVPEAADFIAEATICRRHAGQTYVLCADHPCAASGIARALRTSVHPLFVLPLPVMILRAAKALQLPLPFKRDQIDRLVLPKLYSNDLARRDYDFRPQSFLEYLIEGGK